MMASRLNIAVIPVRLEGLDRVLHQTWKMARPGRVKVTFGKALKLMRAMIFGALAAKVEKAVRDLGS